MVNNYLDRPEPSVGHLPVRLSVHCGIEGVSLSLEAMTVVLLLVGPLFTTWTVTFSSPVVTFPPVFPPDCTTPVVVFEIPPEAPGNPGSCDVWGTVVATGVGVPPLPRTESRLAAYAAVTHVSDTRVMRAMNAATCVDTCVFIRDGFNE
jgi:hypothetical protein